MTRTLTRDLGAFVAGLEYDDIPFEAVRVINMAFADCIGCTIAGASEPAPRILAAMLAPAGGVATLLGMRGRASALDAAWINGTAAHALDFDDVAQRGGHPSAALVPAILAEAEALGATGEQMIVAYAAGYETLADLVARDADQHHDKGWHPTGVFGALGAAAACASLRGLNAEQAAMAIAASASQSGSLVSNFGTMTKPFHAGRAAHAGVASARLAALGFTAALDALEHAPGLLSAVSPRGRIDVESSIKAGAPWQILGSNRLAIKKYPLCYCVHRALDGLLDLLEKHPLKAEDIERVTVSLSPRNATILQYQQPQTGLEAKFSMQFAVASAVIARRASLPELADDFVRRRDMQDLMKRVTMTTDERPDPKRAGFSVHDTLVIHTRDGRVLETGPITSIRGDPDLPLCDAELWDKFEACIASSGAGIPARRLFDTLMSLNRLSHVGELITACESA